MSQSATQCGKGPKHRVGLSTIFVLVVIIEILALFITLYRNHAFDAYAFSGDASDLWFVVGINTVGILALLIWAKVRPVEALRNAELSLRNRLFYGSLCGAILMTLFTVAMRRGIIVSSAYFVATAEEWLEVYGTATEGGELMVGINPHATTLGDNYRIWGHLFTSFDDQLGPLSDRFVADGDIGEGAPAEYKRVPTLWTHVRIPKLDNRRARLFKVRFSGEVEYAAAGPQVPSGRFGTFPTDISSVVIVPLKGEHVNAFPFFDPTFQIGCMLGVDALLILSCLALFTSCSPSSSVRARL